MGVCASRPQASKQPSSSSISHSSSSPEKWSRKSSSKNTSGGGGGGGGDGGESSMSPMVSMTFLRKYSFATVNPAFADFENVLRNSEEEEAASKLRSLARQSFSGWHDPPCESEKKVSFRHEETHEALSCCKLEQGPWKEIEELQNQASVNGSKDDSTSSSAAGTNRAAANQVITEERLVLSSSCMPDCSLGLVAVPEPRAARRQALGKRSPSGSTDKASKRQLQVKKKRILVAS